MKHIATLSVYQDEDGAVVVEQEADARSMIPNLSSVSKMEFTGDNALLIAVTEALGKILAAMVKERNERSRLQFFEREIRILDQDPVTVRMQVVAGSDGYEVTFPDGRMVLMTRHEWVSTALCALHDACRHGIDVARQFRAEISSPGSRFRC